MAQAAPIQLESELSRHIEAVNTTLEELLPRAQGAEARLLEAMRYAALAEGKRLRSFLAVQWGRVFGVDERAMLRVGAAIECLHTYALLHDDLPAIEDEDERRGQPATHRAFDEGTAVLAGDALLTLGFAILVSQRTSPDPFVRCALMSHVTEAVGHAGLVGGQMIDVGTKDGPSDIGTITRLQRMKTGSLIAFSCEAAAIMARANEDMVHAVNGYAHDLGLALQIVTELARGDTPAAANVEEDGENSGKASFVTILGPGRARGQAELLARQAIGHLDLFGEKADPLRQIADFVVEGRF